MNLFVRKLGFVRLQIVRRIVRMGKRGSCASVLANSVPKSGTHLLTQVLESFPSVMNYRTFLASKPSWTYVERADRVIRRRIAKFVPGEMVTGHLFFKPEFARLLDDAKVVQYIIYRDPRDVVCSEAHYLSRMARFHRLHGAFKRLSSDHDRLMFSIYGSEYADSPVPLENIRSRYALYQPWIQSPNVCAIRFEDLVGRNQEREVERICKHYLNQGECRVSVSLSSLVDQAMESINPRRSHTYRSGGGVGNWRKHFDADHRKSFAEVAGDLLEELGYPSEMD